MDCDGGGVGDKVQSGYHHTAPVEIVRDMSEAWYPWVVTTDATWWGHLWNEESRKPSPVEHRIGLPCPAEHILPGHLCIHLQYLLTHPGRLPANRGWVVSDRWELLAWWCR